VFAALLWLAGVFVSNIIDGADRMLFTEVMCAYEVVHNA